MWFQSFIEGPLLWIVFLILLVGFFARMIFFSISVIKSSQNKNPKLRYIVRTFGRFFLPFHMGLVKKPIYTSLRVIFHIFMLIVPVWLSGHIVLWSESRFEWEWAAIPDVWADWMTIIILALALYFIIRRCVVTELRHYSTSLDYILIILTVLPFLTGYFLAQGTLDDVAFLGNNMHTLHVLSAEVMMFMVVFLFTKTWINRRTCTGCAACELACPTGTLETMDEEKYRTINYSHYQCIACASCVSTCPESAVELTHEISPLKLFGLLRKYETNRVELQQCKGCEEFFAPDPIVRKVEKTMKDDFFRFCSKCRRENLGTLLSHTP